jgi:hypothetical protein
MKKCAVRKFPIREYNGSLIHSDTEKSTGACALLSLLIFTECENLIVDTCSGCTETFTSPLLGTPIKNEYAGIAAALYFPNTEFCPLNEGTVIHPSIVETDTVSIESIFH